SRAWQIGSTPKRPRSSSMNALTSAGPGRAPWRKTRSPPSRSRSPAAARSSRAAACGSPPAPRSSADRCADPRSPPPAARTSAASPTAARGQPPRARSAGPTRTPAASRAPTTPPGTSSLSPSPEHPLPPGQRLAVRSPSNPGWLSATAAPPKPPPSSSSPPKRRTRFRCNVTRGRTSARVEPRRRAQAEEPSAAPSRTSLPAAPGRGPELEGEPVGGDVLLDGASRREAGGRAPADLARVERGRAVDEGGEVAVVVGDEPRDAVLDDLRHRAAARREHGSPARHRLDHHEAERLLPVDREERREGAGEEVALLGLRHLSEVLDPAAEARADEAVEVRLLERLALLARDPEGQPGRTRDLDRQVAALLRAHPAEEEEVALLRGAERVRLDVDGVRHVREPRQVRAPPLLVARDRDQAGVGVAPADGGVELARLAADRPVDRV